MKTIICEKCDNMLSLDSYDLCNYCVGALKHANEKALIDNDKINAAKRWNVFKNNKPDESGIYLISAESQDPESPYIAIAWWAKRNNRWEILLKQWAEAVSHWAQINPPIFKKDKKNENKTD